VTYAGWAPAAAGWCFGRAAYICVHGLPDPGACQVSATTGAPASTCRGLAWCCMLRGLGSPPLVPPLPGETCPPPLTIPAGVPEGGVQFHCARAHHAGYPRHARFGGAAPAGEVSEWPGAAGMQGSTWTACGGWHAGARVGGVWRVACHVPVMWQVPAPPPPPPPHCSQLLACTCLSGVR